MELQDKTRTHELKTWPHFYSAIISGHKQFELRLNDRDFRVGDLLILKEFDPETGEYSGHWTARRVSYLVSKFPALVEGYVCLGLAPA